MQPWELIDRAAVPGSADDLRLLRRGSEYVINLGRELLMGSRMRGSEEALADLGCAPVAGRPAPRILIGGLGMGFTLRAALNRLPATAEVVVAELVPAVVAWARGPLAHLSGDALADPRARVHEGDVGALIRAGRAAYDAILLDVDNGPEAMTTGSNDGLYDADGLREATAALRPGGVLAVWSATRDHGFSQRLGRQGLTVTETPVHAHGKRGPRHVIWVATKPGRQAARG